MRGQASFRFANRREAGCELARSVWARLRCDPAGADALVLGASPGGLVVAAPVAAGAQAELDMVTVCPIARPGRFGHSLGAVTTTGPAVLVRESRDRQPRDRGSRDRGSRGEAGLQAAAIVSAVAVARQRTRTRDLALRGNRPPSMIAGRTVVVVDDGLGIGVNALAALRHVVRHRPARLWFATPVCLEPCVGALAALADDVISVVTTPGGAMAGSFYADLAPVSDDHVRQLLSTRRPRASKVVTHQPRTSGVFPALVH
jgi:predicted phosphoribosyltransferase